MTFWKRRDADDRANLSSDARRRRPISATLLEDSRLMIEHAHLNGIKLPPEAVETVERAESTVNPLKSLTQFGSQENESQPTIGAAQLQIAYNSLLDQLRPVTPESIRASKLPPLSLLSLQRRCPPLSLLSLQRRWVVYVMLGIAALCLATYAWTLSQIDNWDRLTLTLVFHLVAAAGLGAAFHALFTAYGFLVRGTYDPKYSMTYLIRFFLGVIAGVVPAGMIDPAALTNEGSTFRQFGPGIIALLGGYAAEAVRLILQRIVEMLVTLVQGGADARVEAEKERLRAEHERKVSAERLSLLKKLGNVARGDVLEPKKLRQELDDIQNALLDAA